MKTLVYKVAGSLLFMAGAVLAGSNDPVTTTLYIGQHFELRAHDEPIKYVFSGGNRVARITGSLSSAQRIQQLRLFHGWNVVSIAVGSTNAIEQLSQTSTGGGGITAAYLWNSGSGAFEGVAAGQALSAGSILWLKAETNYVAKLAGTYVEPVAAQVIPDGAWLPAAGLEKWVTTPAATAELWKYDAFNGVWQPTFSNILAPPGQPKPVIAPGEAMYVHSGEPIELQPPDSQLRVTYYHQDHLGSATVVSDAAGALVEESSFYPSGATRHEELVRAIETHYGFSQKERDDESGLQYFGERYTHPALGRWISPDPLGEKGGSQNPYAYVDNNPIKLVDPDGAEIGLSEEIKGNTVTYHFTLKAVVIDNSSRKFDQQKLADFKTRLEGQIKSSYTGTGKGYYEEKGKKPKMMNFVWDTKVDIRVVSDWSQVKADDHVFRIVDQTDSRATGDTKRGHMLISIDEEALRRPTPDQFDKVPPQHPKLPWTKYHQPEAIGAHEYGHSGGLPHQNTKLNLMTEGEVQDYRNVQVELGQIKRMVEAYKAGEVNKRDEKLQKWVK
jgi:RHS repeat-associated protein